MSTNVKPGMDEDNFKVTVTSINKAKITNKEAQTSYRRKRGYRSYRPNVKKDGLSSRAGQSREWPGDHWQERKPDCIQGNRTLQNIQFSVIGSGACHEMLKGISL